LGIGDWGLGIGPIPNPQSPIPKTLKNFYYNIFKLIKLCNQIIK
jgi:hypothetical protein